MRSGCTPIPVGMIGGGPAGLLLSHVLSAHGIGNIVLERASQAHVEARIRAGQIDHDAVEYLVEAGGGGRLLQEGIPQRGFTLRFGATTRRIDLEELTGGKHCTVYGQAELTKDLIASRIADGEPPLFEAEAVGIERNDDGPQVVVYRRNGSEHGTPCTYVVGCDGYFGITRRVVAREAGLPIETRFPHAWVGIFTETPPISDELSYVYHQNGFALCSMRSPKLSRIYLQCNPEDTVEDRDDERFWRELFDRIGLDWGDRFRVGRTLERTVVQLRGYVSKTMRAGNVFLAGDAAHIVPPSAAKGLNLAIADVKRLAAALIARFSRGDASGLADYSPDALRRAWAVQDFSWLMTDLLHSHPARSSFHDRLKLTRLERLTGSRTGLRDFAHQYVGMP